MGIPTILVQGTHGYSGTEADRRAWWYPGDATHAAAPFVQAARGAGVVIPARPFLWSSNLDGVWGRRRYTVWKAAHEALRDHAELVAIHYRASLPPAERPTGPLEVHLVGHSHGGQPCIWLASRAFHNLKIRTLLTVGTPVRADLDGIAQRAAVRADKWVHVTGGTHHWFAKLGALFDGKASLAEAQPYAHVQVPIPHTDDLLDPVVWTREAIWAWLR